MQLLITGKQKVTLDSTFQCLFCNHEKAVNVRLDKKAGIGYLTCKVCGQSFQHQINCAYSSLSSIDYQLEKA